MQYVLFVALSQVLYRQMIVEIKYGKSFCNLLNRACLMQCSTNLMQASGSKNCMYQPYPYIFPNKHSTALYFRCIYFNSNIVCSIRLFCIRWFFLIDLFSNILHSFEFLILPNIRLHLKTGTTKFLVSLYWHFLHLEFRDSVKLCHCHKFRE